MDWAAAQLGASRVCLWKEMLAREYDVHTAEPDPAGRGWHRCGSAINPTLDGGTLVVDTEPTPAEWCKIVLTGIDDCDGWAAARLHGALPPSMCLTARVIAEEYLAGTGQPTPSCL